MPAYTNAKQVIPELFKQIVRNDNQLREIRALPVIPLIEAASLVHERREYRRAAEQMLKWNTDKGDKAK